ncbi:MAG: polysaccharide biosynthesis protein [Clostridia bacterium]|nr:polysaccharide biosynthesis protein [Clostridia bacterium]
MKNNVKSITRGAVSLGIGAFISKILGAIYRIPLTNILGGLGLGLYQMVFPVYALLLDFSGAGVPSALSKIIAQNGEDKEKRAYEYLSSSIRLLSILGAIGALLMFVLAKPLATMQGNPDAYLGYVFLSPAVFAVSLISCFRGYFQGLLNMTPTAISQVVEQIIKLLFGLILARLFLPDIPKAVAGATFAISVSEFIALAVLFFTYKRRKNVNSLNLIFDRFEHRTRVKRILKTTVPITLVGILIPFSQVIDSFLIVNIIGAYRADATALYGLLGGVAMTVVNLPVSICYGVATVAIPTVSAAKTEAEKNKNTLKTLFLTLAVAVPCAIFCFFFAPFIVNLLFRSLSQVEKTVAVNLLKTASPCVALLSLLQTSNGALIGKGKLYFPVLSLLIGIIVKTVLNLILLKIPSVNIYGGAIALNACYFTSCLINLIMIFNVKVRNGSLHACRREYAS